ncbi:MAG: hypothetical protein GWN07_09875, partial [Actinobacteria bacterium]|nr:hypothetical protein [Actinomycetota bacterium]NIS29333.1 hypothetical protein [Actinomycetota bacterium]NIU64709.1 hypothetical protein [Actinomycetota bacterium]NIW26504.1 hypothetical protein [Actinomycetota bacterium]NIX20116.1 hypothetical protein [Actinomycetota bacterium]
TIAAHARRYGFNFPVLRDPRNRLADRLDARSTPHAFLFDDDLRLRYKGEIDNGFGKPEETTSRGL